MKYAITTSKDLGPECPVPLEPDLPLTDTESTIEDWELVTTTWQQLYLDKQYESLSAAKYEATGRFVWTWKAIYKGASK